MYHPIILMFCHCVLALIAGSTNGKNGNGTGNGNGNGNGSNGNG